MDIKTESKRLRQHKWRVRNQCCVVCGRTRPHRIIMICNQCRKVNNATTQVRA